MPAAVPESPNPHHRAPAPRGRPGRALLVALALLTGATTALAQPAGGTGKGTPTSKVYTCTDAQGRRLTSDRPIMECLNREQRQYERSGASRVVKPEPTQAEREAQAARDKQAQAEREAAAQQRQRDRLLLERFPDAAAHQQARLNAISGPQAMIAAAQSQLHGMQEEKAKLDSELEFYARDSKKTPPVLKRRYTDLANRMRMQAEDIAAQAQEIRRINARFNEQRSALEPMWRAQAAAPVAAPAPAPRAP